MSRRPSVLFVITGDPESSHRPAEAIRIAAALTAWKKAKVTVYLHDAAMLAMCEWRWDLVDGDFFESYLPTLDQLGADVFVQKGSSRLGELDGCRFAFEEMDEGQLAECSARATNLIRF